MTRLIKGNLTVIVSNVFQQDKHASSPTMKHYRSARESGRLENAKDPDLKKNESGTMNLLTAFPLKQCALLLLTVLPEVLMFSLLNPVYPYIAQNLLPEEKDIGYYTGILSVSFILDSMDIYKSYK